MAEVGELIIKVKVDTTEAWEELRKLERVVTPMMNRRRYSRLFYKPVKRFKLSDL